LIMALKYFQTHEGSSNDELLKNANLYLEEGYARLVGYECKDGGYDWFGRSPASEVLTAYGIMEFAELQSVRPDLVNKSMMERTINWLLKRRNGSGGFNINSSFLHVWNVTEHFVNSYACLALTYAGVSTQELEKELNWLKNNLSDMTDPYMMAVLANLFIYINEIDIATQLCDSLLHHIEDGQIGGAKTSITCSGGSSLLVETTSLGLQAFINLTLKTKVSNYISAINNMAKYIFF